MSNNHYMQMINFNKLQRTLIKLFLASEKVATDFNAKLSAFEEAQGKYQEFIDQNSDVKILPMNVETKASMQRLLRIKWYAIVIEAFASLFAIKTFFYDTLGTDISTSLSIIIAAICSYILLSMTIYLLITDAAKSYNNILAKYGSRLTALIPISILPGINIFTYFQGESFLVLVFTIAEIFMCIKVVSYSREFGLLQSTKIYQKWSTNLQNKVSSLKQKCDSIDVSAYKLRQKIMQKATEIWTQWESFDNQNKPKLFIPPQYIYAMNTRIYHNEVLPIGDLTIVNRGGDVEKYRNIWDEVSTRLRQNVVPHTFLTEGETINHNSDPRTVEEMASLESVTSDEKETPYTNIDDPIDAEVENVQAEMADTENEEPQGFGSVISENEKYL